MVELSWRVPTARRADTWGLLLLFSLYLVCPVLLLSCAGTYMRGDVLFVHHFQTTSCAGASPTARILVDHRCCFFSCSILAVQCLWLSCAGVYRRRILGDLCCCSFHAAVLTVGYLSSCAGAQQLRVFGGIVLLLLLLPFCFALYVLLAF